MTDVAFFTVVVAICFWPATAAVGWWWWRLRQTDRGPLLAGGDDLPSAGVPGVFLVAAALSGLAAILAGWAVWKLVELFVRL